MLWDMCRELAWTTVGLQHSMGTSAATGSSLWMLHRSEGIACLQKPHFQPTAAESQKHVACPCLDACVIAIQTLQRGLQSTGNYMRFK